jgi:hypothetical protein
MNSDTLFTAFVWAHDRAHFFVRQQLVKAALLQCYRAPMASVICHVSQLSLLFDCCWLQEMNAALQLLLAHNLPAVQCAKLDVERCR